MSLDVSTAITALAAVSSTPNPDIARVLGTAGLIGALTGLTGGATIVAITTRIAHAARLLTKWAVAASYLVAALCLTGFWNGIAASVLFALWLIRLTAAAPTTPPTRTSA